MYAVISPDLRYGFPLGELRAGRSSLLYIYIYIISERDDDDDDDDEVMLNVLRCQLTY